MQEDMKRGKFIVFEGIDGCGKTTQLKLAANFIFDLSKEQEVLLTREPTRTFRCIREKLQETQDLYESANWFTQMFVKDRQEHLRLLIEPTLANGTHVLCDRYKLSTLAYQSTQGMSLIDLIELHRDMRVPDITFLLQCEPNRALSRRQQRETLSGMINNMREDLFEKKEAFQREIGACYLRLAELLGNEENIVVIDANQSVEDVAQEIREKIGDLFTSKI